MAPRNPKPQLRIPEKRRPRLPGKRLPRLMPRPETLLPPNQQKNQFPQAPLSPAERRKLLKAPGNPLRQRPGQRKRIFPPAPLSPA